MKEVFAIFGYGVPRDIIRDPNYSRYLSAVFNTIFEATAQPGIIPLILFCGGSTDCHPPYGRTEAAEMRRSFAALMHRSFLKKTTSTWRLFEERKSLSAVENMLQLKRFLKTRKTTPAQVTIFCEHTRRARIVALAKKILGSPFAVKVVAIDFDQSQNRYVSPSFIKQKERRELRHALWALKSKSNLLCHHKLMQQKLSFFRKRENIGHAHAVAEWWETQLKNYTV